MRAKSYFQGLLFFFLIVFSFQSIYAQVDDAIVEYNNITSEITRNGDIKVKKNVLIKINNANGKEYGIVKQHYSGFKQIIKIDAKILDRNKSKIRNVKKSEIRDYALRTGYLHTDDRIKVINIVHNKYPYYVEIEIETRVSNFMRFPIWFPTYGHDIICNESSYSIIAPQDYGVNFKLYNFDAKFNKVVDKNEVVWSWTAVNIFSVNENESYSVPFSELIPKGVFVPKVMSFLDEEYNLDTWAGIGKWSSDLIEGKDKLPSEEVEKVLKLTQDCGTDKEKVRKLYKNLQDETRYVGIFEGLGGWIPFDAEYVCKNKYGDCKALTNYMKALLKSIDIKSYYALINAGSNEMDIDTSFVYNQFNHAILFVPLADDTIWLECTSPYNPFGYLGSFTAGRHALICDYSNSKLVKTPSFDHKENSIELKADIIIKNDHLIVKSNRILKGDNYDRFHSFIERNSSENIKEFANNRLDFNHFTILDIDYQSIDNEDPYLIEKATLELKGKIQSFANKIIIEPAHKILEFENKIISERKNSIRIAKNYMETDSLTYRLTDTIAIVSLPDEVFFENEFGSFKQKYEYKNNTILLVKRLKLNEQLKDKEYYPIFESFITAVNKAERQKILIEKITKENE